MLNNLNLLLFPAKTLVKGLSQVLAKESQMQIWGTTYETIISWVCSGVSVVGFVFIQKVGICVFRYNTITVYYSDKQPTLNCPANHSTGELPHAEWAHLEAHLQVYTLLFKFDSNKVAEKALMLYTPVSVWSKHGYSAKQTPVQNKTR